MNSTLIPVLLLFIGSVSAKHIETAWPFIELSEDVSTRSIDSDESLNNQKRLIEFKRIVEFKRDLEQDIYDLDLYLDKILNLKKYKGRQAVKRPSIISGTRSIHGTRSFN